MDYIAAHRKALLAALAAVLVIFVDDATAQSIIAAANALLIFLVPNDQEAKARIYGKRGTPDHGPPGKPDTTKK